MDDTAAQAPQPIRQGCGLLPLLFLLVAVTAGGLGALLAWRWLPPRVEEVRPDLTEERTAVEEHKKKADELMAKALQELHKAEEMRDDAQRQLREANAKVGQLIIQEVGVVVSPDLRLRYALHLALAATRWERDPERGRAVLEDVQAAPLELRDFAWSYYARLCRRPQPKLGSLGPAVRALGGNDGPPRLMATGMNPRKALLTWGLVAGPREGQGIHWAGTAPGGARGSLPAEAGEPALLALSADGTLLATWGSDKALKLWPLARPDKPRILAGGPVEDLTALALSPDGKRLAAAGKDRGVRLWDLDGGQMPQTLAGHSVEPTTLRFSDQGNLLASAGQNELLVWELETQRSQLKLKASGPMAFTPDGRAIAVVERGETSSVALWHIATERRWLTVPAANVSALAFAPDGRTLATADRVQGIRLWDPVIAVERAALPGPRGEVSQLVFRPDGTALLGLGDDGRVRVWEAGPPAERVALGAERVLALSADGSQALVCSAGALVDPGLDARAPNTVRERYGAVQLWDLDRGGLMAFPRFPRMWVSAGALSPDGTTAAFGTDGHAVVLYDARTGRHLCKLSSHSARITALAFSPDGLGLVSASADRTVVVWDVLKQVERQALVGHAGAVKDVAFVDDGQGVVSLGEDQTIRLWDVRQGMERVSWSLAEGPLPFPERLAVAPDGRTVAVAGRRAEADPSGSGLLIGDLVEKRRRLVRGSFPSGICSLAFSADGQTLAVGCAGGSVRLLDLASGEERAVRAGFRGRVQWLAFQSDGKRLTAGGWPTGPSLPDGAGGVRVWQLSR
jgi:WD40 repeat protein